MEQLNKQQLLTINGGGFGFVIALGIGALVSFFIGLVDGYVRPLRCR